LENRTKNTVLENMQGSEKQLFKDWIKLLF